MAHYQIELPGSVGYAGLAKSCSAGQPPARIVSVRPNVEFMEPTG